MTGVFVGLAPALESLAPQLTRALKQEAHRSTRAMHRTLRGALVVGELAISLVLLSGATLMVQSFHRMMQTRLGFNPEKVVTADLNLLRGELDRSREAPLSTKPRKLTTSDQQKDSSGRSPKEGAATAADRDRVNSSRIAAALFQQQLLDRVRSLPGVVAAGQTDSTPLKGRRGYWSFYANGQSQGMARIFEIGGDYFQAMGIPIVKGRSFSEAEVLDGAKLIVISESLARALWPNGNPVGQHLIVEESGGDVEREVVGVVGDVTSLDVPSEQNKFWQFYFPAQGAPETTLVVRTASDANKMIAPIRREISSMNRDIAVFNIKTMDDVISAFTAPPRFRAVLLGWFAFMAFGLAAFGVYGVMAYSVACQTHEIGVRIAMGANSGDVIGLIVWEGMRLAVAGAAIGIGLSLVLNRSLQSLLFGIRAADPASMAVSAGLLIAAAFAACYFPARRAMRLNPMVALRHE